MNSQDMKKEKGVGTFALVLGLLPTILTAQYNGVSILNIIMDALHLTYAPYMAAFGLVLSIPGLILGIIRNKDWGAAFGAFCCGANFVFTVFQLVMEYIMK